MRTITGEKKEEGMTIKQAKELLEPHFKNEDDEAFHSVFDDIIEARLMEVDPKFMKAMKKYYKDTDMSRWCA